MISLVEQNQTELAEHCREFHVRKLELFGSAVDEERFDAERSDLDFLVEFESTDVMGPSDQFFGLLEALRQLFGREVDLVTVRSLRNPYFIKSVNQTRQVLYAC